MCKLSRKGKDLTLKCGQVKKEQREELFQKFWIMNSSEKKGTVRSLVTKRTPLDVGHRKNDGVSRRNQTLQFHLKIMSSSEAGNSEVIVRVCRKMFLNTLGLK